MIRPEKMTVKTQEALAVAQEIAAGRGHGALEGRPGQGVPGAGRI